MVKSNRNRFTKAVRMKFVEGFKRNLTNYLKYFNSNGHNHIQYGIARWFHNKYVPNKSG